MSPKDLADIPTKGFTKAWWQKHRSIKATGSGVGKALDAWVAADLPPAKPLSASIEKKDKGRTKKYKDAFAAIAALEAALKVAKAKAASAKDTVAGIAIYEKEVKKHKKALDDSYQSTLQDCLNNKQIFSSRTGQRLAEHQTDLDTIERIQKQIDSMEKMANQMLAANKPDEVDRYAGAGESLVAQAETAMNNISQRFAANSAWDNVQKATGESPDHYGIQAEDLPQIKKYMEEATNNIFNTTGVKNVATTKLKEIQETLAGIKELKTLSAKSMTEWVKKANELEQEAASAINPDSGGSGQLVRNATKSLQWVMNLLNAKTLDQKTRDDLQVRLQSLNTDIIRMPRMAPKLEKVMKAKSRIPANIQNSPLVKPLMTKIDAHDKQMKTDIKTMTQIEGMLSKAMANIKKKFPE